MQIPFTYNGQYTYEDLGIDIPPNYEEELEFCKNKVLETIQSDGLNLDKCIEDQKKYLEDIYDTDFPYERYFWNTEYEDYDSEIGLDILLDEFEQSIKEDVDIFKSCLPNKNDLSETDCGVCYRCVTMTSECQHKR